MPDPVSNVEIEDVLSSIRRLVSEDVTPSPSETADVTPPQESPMKLVLTPDFRIDDDCDAAANAPEPAQIPEEAEDIRHETLETRIAELEATLAEHPGDWEPDGSDFSEDSDAEQMIGDHTDTLTDHQSNETADAEQAFEDAAAGQQPPLEIDFATHNKHEYTPLKDVNASTDQQDEYNAEDHDPFYSPDAILDEDALRDLVSEIVREELQGALGERITRNVRKLVRREINRVLSNQDFE